jgi:hypothetical protein
MSTLKRIINLGISEGISSFLPFIYYPILLSKLGVIKMGGLVINQVFISFGLILMSAGLRVYGPTRILSVKRHEERKSLFTNIIGLNMIILGIIAIAILFLSLFRSVHVPLVLLGIAGTYYNGNWFYIAFNEIKLYRNMQLTFQLSYGLYIFVFMTPGTSDIIVLIVKSVLQLFVGFVFLYNLRINVSFSLLSLRKMKTLVKSGFRLVLTDYLNNLKDKLHFVVLGILGKQDLAAFVDGGIKLLTVAQKPLSVLSVAFLGDIDRSDHRKKMILVLLSSLIIYITFLPLLSWLVDTFMADLSEFNSVYMFFLFSVIPLSLTSYLINNIFIYNELDTVVLNGALLVSILYLIGVYILSVLGLFDVFGILLLMLTCYSIELIYYLWRSRFY